ncbi:amidohydrolase family protein [candidate division KSB1 bacterium]
MKISRRDFLKDIAIFGAAQPFIAPYIITGKKTNSELDILIKGGFVVDGSGNPGKKSDIGVKGNRIRYIGPECKLSSDRIIKADNLTVAPGFIDVHTHTDIELLVVPSGGSKLMQGVTTEIGGNCGSSIAPRSYEEDDDYRKNIKNRYGFEADWTNFSQFFNKLKKNKIGINFCTFLGLGTIRSEVIGNEDRPPTASEMEKMKNMTKTAMEEGVFGISTGLEYVPSSFATEDEIAELAKVAAGYNGVYATHIRNEDDTLEEAVTEALNVAKKANISLQISHLKACREKNWYKVEKILKQIHSEKEKGVNVDFDRYPYTAYSTGLANLFPIWSREGGTRKFIERLNDGSLTEKIKETVLYKVENTGSWNSFMITSVKEEKNKRYQGKTIKEISEKFDFDPYEFTRNLIIEEHNRVGIVGFAMSEENTRAVLSDPLCIIGSDGAVLSTSGPLSKGNPHPRNYGTFPRAIGKYARKDKIFSLEEVIRKITSAPARKFNIINRGMLTEGFYADIVIFDYNKIIDKADYSNPHQYPEGINFVVVNGKIVAEKNEPTGELPGMILKLNG